MTDQTPKLFTPSVRVPEAMSGDTASENTASGNTASGNTDANESTDAYWFLFQGARLIVLPDREASSGGMIAGQQQSTDRPADSKREAKRREATGRNGPHRKQRLTVPMVQDPTDLGLSMLNQQYLGYCHSGDDSPVAVSGLPATARASVTHCFSGEIGVDVRLPDPLVAMDLRQLWNQMDDLFFAIAGRAKQIVQWDRDHQFCSRCAHSMETVDYERAKRCPECDLTSYPRISPAIITAITRTVPAAGTGGQEQEMQILMARSHRFPPGMYSVVAGFVEAGESLEQCVAREVYEEVGVKLRNIRYFSSQPWPFPNSLMLGFTAEYAGGELRLEEEEIADAGWFSVENMPKVPPKISIARQLIDWFMREAGGDPGALQSW